LIGEELQLSKKIMRKQKCRAAVDDERDGAGSGGHPAWNAVAALCEIEGANEAAVIADMTRLRQDLSSCADRVAPCCLG
jgi:hypothetical protein